MTAAHSRSLTREQADAFGRELDALRQTIVADLGQRDVDHIRAHHSRRPLPARPSAASCSTSASDR